MESLKSFLAEDWELDKYGRMSIHHIYFDLEDKTVSLGRVKKLHISNSKVNLGVIYKIFPNLTLLSLNYCDVEGSISSKNIISELEIGSCKVDETLSFLKNFIHVEFLKLRALGSPNQKVIIPSSLEHLRKLQDLVLVGLHISDFQYSLQHLVPASEHIYATFFIHECSIEVFPQDIPKVSEYFGVFSTNNTILNYSKEELEAFHAKYKECD